MEIRPYEPAHLDDAAGVLAKAHERRSAELPALPGAFSAADETRVVIGAFADRPGCAGYSAFRDGRLTGFLLATRHLPAPAHPSSAYVMPRSTWPPTQAWAIGDDCDPRAVFEALYSAVASDAVGAGYLNHQVEVNVGDPAENWLLDLGYTRSSVYAALPVGGAAPAEHHSEAPGQTETGQTAIRRARAGDEELVAAVGELNARHHQTSPVFRPDLSEDYREAVLDAAAELVIAQDRMAFLAFTDGDFVGGILANAMGSGRPLFRPADSLYIGSIAVAPAHRGRGIGQALVGALLLAARAEGFEHAVLNYAPANASGRRFWQKMSFQPLMTVFQRRVDPRIAWGASWSRLATNAAPASDLRATEPRDT